MGEIPGRNNGVTGLLDLIPSGTYPLIQLEILGFGLALAAKMIDISGPGDNLVEQYYGSTVSGNFSGHADVAQTAHPPFPPTMVNVQGNLTVQMHTGCNITLPVIVERLTCRRKVKMQNAWSVDVTMLKNGAEGIIWPNATSVTYAQPSLLTKELFNEQADKSLDPNALQSSATVKTFLPTPASGTNSNYTDVAAMAAVTAYQATAPAPSTALKIVESAFIRVDDRAGLLFTRWALKSTADEATFPHAREYRSGLSAWTSSQPAIVTTSGTLSDQADSLWAAFQSTLYARGMALVPLTDGKRLAIYEYVNPGIELSGQSGAGRYVMARLNGTNPQLFIVQNIATANGQQLIRFGRQFVQDKLARRFITRRNLQGSTIPEQGPSMINGKTLPPIGSVNVAPFLTNVTSSGMGPLQVLYEGPKYTVHGGLSGTLPFLMGYSLRSDALGIVQGFPDHLFRGWNTITTNVTSSGWTNVSDIGTTPNGIPFNQIVCPGAGNFDAFVA